MSLSQDGWFVDTVVKMSTNTIALDLSAASGFKGAMFTDSVVPNFSQASPAYGSTPWNANEVSGTGYTAGGVTIAVVSYAELAGSPGKTGWKIDPLTWTSSTITGARGLLIYATGLSNRAVLLRKFGQDYATQSGTFEITAHADGVARFNLTP